MKNQYIVICLVGGDYVMATHRRFISRASAEKYAKTVAPSLDPRVVPVKAVELSVNGYPK